MTLHSRAPQEQHLLGLHGLDIVTDKTLDLHVAVQLVWNAVSSVLQQQSGF